MIRILQTAYAVTLFAVALRLLPTVFRALTKRVQGKDFDYMLFCGLSINRLFFLYWTIAYYTPAVMAGEVEWLAVCYVFAISFEWGVLASHRWDGRNVS